MNNFLYLELLAEEYRREKMTKAKESYSLKRKIASLFKK